MLSLVMEFLDSSASFGHGFECGIVWSQMKRGDLVIQNSFHLANYQQLVMMANQHGYAITACTFLKEYGRVELTFRLKFWKRLKYYLSGGR